MIQHYRTTSESCRKWFQITGLWSHIRGLWSRNMEPSWNCWESDHVFESCVPGVWSHFRKLERDSDYDVMTPDHTSESHMKWSCLTKSWSQITGFPYKVIAKSNHLTTTAEGKSDWTFFPYLNTGNLRSVWLIIYIILYVHRWKFLKGFK